MVPLLPGITVVTRGIYLVYTLSINDIVINLVNACARHIEDIFKFHFKSRLSSESESRLGGLSDSGSDRDSGSDSEQTQTRTQTPTVSLRLPVTVTVAGRGGGPPPGRARELS